ncbi:MAG: hypothetical protein BWY63_02660 [Chloroflexi bacterium ADurb.Bin360]|nr:MAG: hypothetical protein BWY63_02660 [Chloroflexi bacterium ADurb.Bin360]
MGHAATARRQHGLAIRRADDAWCADVGIRSERLEPGGFGAQVLQGAPTGIGEPQHEAFAGRCTQRLGNDLVQRVGVEGVEAQTADLEVVGAQCRGGKAPDAAEPPERGETGIIASCVGSRH